MPFVVRTNEPQRHPMSGMDAFSPAEIAALVQTRGVAKANAPLVTTFVLGVLAGAFIGLGAVLSTTITAGSQLGYGITKWLSGVGFSLGLILVVIAGAELFTGNNLIVMAVVDRQVTVSQLLRNWGIVYVGNFVGALSIALMVWLGKWWAQGDSAVGATALSIAAGKASLPFWVVFFRGVLANALVCLAVWLAAGGRSVVDKIFAIIFPISAFVAAGFEHSVANMYFIPMGMLIKNEAGLAKGLARDRWLIWTGPGSRRTSSRRRWATSSGARCSSGWSTGSCTCVQPGNERTASRYLRESSQIPNGS
jgi:formate transporter